MNEQEKLKQLLESSPERVGAHVDKLLKNQTVKAAIQREQNPARKDDPSRKVA
jgi:hypothetical protein